MPNYSFLNGHLRSVTFVGLDKLNKTLVSASSDGVVLVCDSQCSANISCGISKLQRLKEKSTLAVLLLLAKCRVDC